MPAIPPQESTIPDNPLPVWINGTLHDAGAAQISALDSGFLLGLGVFETLAIRDGRTFALRRHLARLQKSAEALTITPPSEETLRTAIAEIQTAAARPDLRLRISLSAGPCVSGPFDTPGPPTLVVSAAPLPLVAETAALASVPWRRAASGALAGIKCLSYAENTRCLREARRLGADEALVLNEHGDLCEGATSNLWWVAENILHTPSLDTGCLPGVTREILLEITKGLGIKTRQAAMPPSVLATADEVLLTSSIRGVQGVRSLDTRTWPDAPGPLTRRLAAALTDLCNKRVDP